MPIDAIKIGWLPRHQECLLEPITEGKAKGYKTEWVAREWNQHLEKRINSCGQKGDSKGVTSPYNGLSRGV